MTEPHLCLVLEFMKGGSLFQAVKSKKIDPYQQITFACNIATGLTYLHNEVKVIHRDIKPQNILVSLMFFWFIYSLKAR